MADSNQAKNDDSLFAERVSSLMREQSRSIKGLKNQLSNQLKREIANSTKQLEAHQGLQLLIGDLPAPFHGWPVSPDFALQLVRLIRDQSYDLIVEFGSGTSTWVCLKALEEFNLYSANDAESPIRLIAFEHLDEFHRKTSDLLDKSRNRALLDLQLSPLEAWSDATGSYSYYSNTDSIVEAVRAVAASAERRLKVLVVIDGPPGATCRWARYPAIPIVLDKCSKKCLSIDFLLADLIRDDEREMSLAWEHYFQVLGLNHQRTDYAFEKGGLLLRVENLAGCDTSIARYEASAREKQEQDAIASAVTRVDELLLEIATFKKAADLEKVDAQKAVEELKHQLLAKASELETERKERAAGAERVKALEGELAGVKGERDARAKEKEEAREEAELTLLQLHQVQEELENYFLLSREQSSLLAVHEEQHKRVEKLLNDVVLAGL